MRIIRTAVVASLVLMSFTAQPAAAAPPANDVFAVASGVAAAGCTPGDLNGDGLGDIAVGAPGEDVGRARNAGAVNVLFGRVDGSYGGGMYLTQESVGQVSQAGDMFGSAVLVADVTEDGCADLVVGVPGEDRGTGRVVIALGSGSGISGTRRVVLRQGYAGAAGKAERGDKFGAALAVGPDYVTSPAQPVALYVGAPGEDVGARVDAGSVTVFPAAPLTTARSVQLYQGLRWGRGRVGGVAEAGDRFGASLATGRLIGAPGEDVGRITDAGSVYEKDPTGDDYRELTQNSSGIPDLAEPGDKFGAAVASATFGCEDQLSGVELSIPVDFVGAPGEDVGSRADVGYVAHFGGTTSNDHNGIYTEYDWVSVPAPGQAGARFGSALAISSSHLLVGSPGTDIGAAVNAGAVISYPTRVSCSHDWTSSWRAITGPRDAAFRGVPERADAFGAKLAVVPSAPDRFLVGALGETVGAAISAGAVTVLDLTADTSQEITQNTPGVPGAAEAGDRFGEPSAGQGTTS